MFIEKANNKNICENLSEGSLNFIWLAEHAKVDFNLLREQANSANINIAGGTFPGILYGKKHYDDGAIIHYLPKDTTTQLIPHQKEVELPKLPETCSSIYLMVDGLAEGIPNVLLTLYQKYWDQVVFVGGGCGSLSLKQAPCIFTNNGFYQDHSLIVMTSDRLQIGIQHGWEKIAGPFLITKAKGNTIQEINWEPAFKLYKNTVDEFSPEKINQEHFFDVSKAYPFGIGREGYEDIVRDPIVTTDGADITCVGEMPQNATINILKGDKKQLIDSAALATKIAVKDISPNSIFVVDCISRVLFLEDQFEDELSAIQNELEQGSKVEIEGVLTLGEISTYGDGLIEFLNKTIVVSAKY